MGYFHFANCSKKIISIVLLMIIFTTTISFAVSDTDIDDINTNVVSNLSLMTKLYAAGQELEPPLSEQDVRTKIRNYIRLVMIDAEKAIKNGGITKTKYKEGLVFICGSDIYAIGLDKLLDVAYPDWSSQQVPPPDLVPLYNTLKTEVPLKLGLTSLPITPPANPPTGGGDTKSGGTGSGGTTSPIITPILPPVNAKIFNDLQGVEWAENAINTLAEAGVISKNDEMKFEPLNNVKREEFVKLIVSGFNLKNPNATSDFTDVDKDSWFYPYVSSMAMLNLVKGFNNSFGSGQDITRQDIAVLLYRVMQYVGIDATPSEPELFNDDAQISDYAKSSVYIMRQIGIIKGTPENTFEPTSFATRAEAAQMIYNTYKIYIAKK